MLKKEISLCFLDVPTRFLINRTKSTKVLYTCNCYIDLFGEIEIINESYCFLDDHMFNINPSVYPLFIKHLQDAAKSEYQNILNESLLIV